MSEKSKYWQHITDPKNDFMNKLIELLHSYQIEYPGHEFIVHPATAIKLLDDLSLMGIAVNGVTVWCYVADVSKNECCPDGMGGPSKLENGIRSGFLEYTHLGYAIPEFDEREKTLDFAAYSNLLVKQYIHQYLPQERGYNSCFRVSLDLYIPHWNLFP